MNPKDIIIREDFKALCPPLTEAELEQLHCSLDGHGCRDPLVVWKGKNVLVDGHNRYAYCVANGIEFQLREIRFIHDDDAKNFIILNQLGRRNLSPEAASMLRGKLYYARKQEHGGDRRSHDSSGNNCHSKANTTAKQVADETGVSEKTVRNDAEFAAASEKLCITKDVIAGKIKRKRSRIVKAAKALPDNPTNDQVEKAKNEVMAPKRKANQPEPESLRDRVLRALNSMLCKFKAIEKEQVKAIILEQLQ